MGVIYQVVRCPKCGMHSVKGVITAGKQMLKCHYCNKASSINSKVMIAGRYLDPRQASEKCKEVNGRKQKG